MNLIFEIIFYSVITIITVMFSIGAIIINLFDRRKEDDKYQSTK